MYITVENIGSSRTKKSPVTHFPTFHYQSAAMKQHTKDERLLPFELLLQNTQLTFTCPKSTTETLENGVKYVQRRQ